MKGGRGKNSGTVLRASGPESDARSLARCHFEEILPLPETQFLHLLHRWLGRILPKFPSSSDTWSHGRVGQGLELVTLGLRTPAHPLRPSSARLEETPRADIPPHHHHHAAHPTSQLEGGLGAQKP